MKLSMKPAKMTPHEKYVQMTETPVRRLIATLAGPTIVSMLITSIYNMADTFFVGKLSTAASGGVGVAFPVQSLIQALGFMFGTGAGNYLSRLLGAKDDETARKVVATGFYSALFLSIILAGAGLAFRDRLITILGTTDTIFPHAQAYLQYIFFGMPFMVTSIVLNNLLRYQGNSFYAMLGLTAGGIINMALDPLLIFGFNMGTGGAALATAISQFISFSILLWQTKRCGAIWPLLKEYKLTPRFLYDVTKGGFPSLARQSMQSVSNTVMNNVARSFGDPAIAAMSIVGRIMWFFLSLIMGFGQGYQPVCGYNYGAKKYRRVLDGLKFTIQVAFCGLIAVAIIGQVFGEQIVGIFRDDPQVIEIGAAALRFQMYVVPLAAVNMFFNMFLQTTGFSWRATVIAICRQGLCYIPCVLLLSNLLGILGLQLSQSVADVFAFILALAVGMPVIMRVNRLAKLQEETDIPVIPPCPEETAEKVEAILADASPIAAGGEEIAPIGVSETISPQETAENDTEK